jgi:urease accessory protein
VRAAHEATEQQDAETLTRVAADDRCARTAPAQRRASLTLGRNLLRAAVAVALPSERERVAWVAGILGDTAPRGAAFGAISACFGAAASDAVAAYVYSALSAMVAAAVRLGLVSPLEGQATLRRVLSAEQAGPEENWGFFSPLLDIASMRHALLEPRLFAS